jgi:LmbE family N-acetylglucosaminyl deacetylase
MKEKIVVLGVGAHSDDLDFGAAGTFAKFAKDGADCYYLVCTDGSKGSRDPKMTPKRLAGIRAGEQKASAKMLGVKDVFFLKHKDGEIVADLRLRKEIVRYIRKLKPDIVITQDPTFLYSDRFVNHADHRAVGTATIDAVFPAARNPMTFPELKKEGLDVHRVKQMYLVNRTNPNYAVDISEFVDLKVKALLQHQSQGIGKHSEFVKDMAKTMGKRWKFKYAETFFKIDFAI